MISGVLRAAAATVPSMLAQLTVPYKDTNGGNQNWSGSAVAVPLTGQAQYQPDGKWIKEGYTLCIDWATLDPRHPEEGDLIYLQFPDEDRFACVIRGATPVRGAALTLTVERHFV